ncbi:glycosyltransferase family 39 protein [Microcoleus sp. LEGE 07076]|uniref:glycosyltransferase family 39 protein n=1 Tax=Microcoleus sp. LEGE 07076 TaxID=915322 RepID=UPI0018803B6B|nr:glycosyltransferase family 39 protein [Microcoleus sp. LEGE 07076]MBE9183619.1 glycosyltransferase family 39 protein [Microcoleus sp. LEGE 07076]
MSQNKQLLVLLLWTAIALMLRFANLDSKPLWTDEFSTLVFSLGNSFRDVPIDRPIDLPTLLKPLQFRAGAGIADVLNHLLLESNHPPVYFMLAHWWMRLFAPTQDSLVWIGRSLPALLGAISVPAIYFLGKFAFNSRLVGQCAAAMMAVSPYGIYLAQEARHYTLGILLVIASLFCLTLAAKKLVQRAPMPVWAVLLWIVVNCLGIASHYFFVLTLGAETIALIVVIWQEFNQKLPASNESHPNIWQSQILWRLLAVAIGTVAGGLVWVPIFLSNKYGSELTNWLVSGDRTFVDLINPIVQALAGWITIVSLLPVESPNLAVVAGSAIGMTIFLLWALPLLPNALKTSLKTPKTHLGTVIFGGFVLGAIFQFFSFAYILGIDLTRGPRYNFVYFPGAILLLGATLAVISNTPTVKSQWFNLPDVEIAGKKAVVVILVMGFLSGVTVNSNLGYRKYYKPDFLVPTIREVSKVPVLIATTQKTHVEIGELMGIGLEWERRKKEEGSSATDYLTDVTDVSPREEVRGKKEEVRGKKEEVKAFDSPRFLLVKQRRDAPEIVTGILDRTLSQLERPLDLWLVNFRTPVNLAEQKCQIESRQLPGVDGYEYQIYHCSS